MSSFVLESKGSRTCPRSIAQLLMLDSGANGRRREDRERGESSTRTKQGPLIRHAILISAVCVEDPEETAHGPHARPLDYLVNLTKRPVFKLIIEQQLDNSLTNLPTIEDRR